MQPCLLLSPLSETQTGVSVRKPAGRQVRLHQGTTEEQARSLDKGGKCLSPSAEKNVCFFSKEDKEKMVTFTIKENCCKTMDGISEK